MNNLTCRQRIKAYKILNVLCKDGFIELNEMYSMFKTIDEAVYVCSYLATEKMLYMAKASNIIYSLRKSDLTCIALKNRLLSKNPIWSKFINNPIFQLLGLIVTIYTFLKIIEAILKIDIPII